jgi:methylenetetrahydrofolate dehydrogenase (NADP+)/methenyltetrahydrofolate cyclohydrolase
MELLDGNKVSAELRAAMKGEVDNVLASGGRAPHLVAVLVGNDGASETYVANKVKACKETGFLSTLHRFDASISESELLGVIDNLNRDDGVDGMIVQLPLPPHISVRKVTEAILPSKDVDGFHPVNSGRLMQQLPGYVPATPLGIIMLLEHYKIETEGKHCVVIGRSNIVGTPVALLMARNGYPGNCTVTVCHSKTRHLGAVTREADILIAATGRPGMVGADMVREGAVVIDVGITRMPSAETKSGYRLFGDVRFDEVAPKTSYITPVPRGVGPMTIVGLLTNTLNAARKIYSY